MPGETPGQNPDIIDHVPSATELDEQAILAGRQIPRSEVVAMRDQIQAGEAEGQQLLTGPRQTGEVPMPASGVAVHEVTRDGMKQTRIQGERYKSAADFHREAGVAQPYEQLPTQK